MPDMGTFAEIPWQPGDGPRGTARVICDVFTPRGEPFVGDPRHVLRRQVERARNARLRREHGPGARVLPLPARTTTAGSRRCPTTRRATSTSRPTSPRKSARTWSTRSRPSGSASRRPTTRSPQGQHEIDFEYADALQTADNAITFKFALKAIAQQHGLYATFMPKPIHGINGSGMHTHQSL